MPCWPAPADSVDRLLSPNTSGVLDLPCRQLLPALAARDYCPAGSTGFSCPPRWQHCMLRGPSRRRAPAPASALWDASYYLDGAGACRTYRRQNKCQPAPAASRARRQRQELSLARCGPTTGATRGAGVLNGRRSLARLGVSSANFLNQPRC